MTPAQEKAAAEAIAEIATKDLAKSERHFEDAARAVGLVNEFDLHRNPDGSYSMLNTRKLFALFMTGYAVALSGN